MDPNLCHTKTRIYKQIQPVGIIYRDYSDAILDQLISICIFPNSRCRTNLIECTFPCTNQPSEMDLRVGRDETT